MKRILVALLIIFALLSPVCYAADKHEVSIGYTPVCKHYESGEDLNEEIHLVMVSVDQWTFATYNNSHFERSYFAGRTFRTDKKVYRDKLYCRFNLTVGLLTGYEGELPGVGNVTIVPLPTFELGHKNFSIETMILPLFGCLFKYTF